MEDSIMVVLTAMTMFTAVLLVIVIIDFFKTLKAIKRWNELTTKEEEKNERCRRN